MPFPPNSRYKHESARETNLYLGAVHVSISVVKQSNKVRPAYSTGGNVVRGNRAVMQMKSLRDHPDMSYGSNKQWNQLCE